MPISVDPQICAVLRRLIAVALISVTAAPPVVGAQPDSPPRFERDIWPIISARCLACHGADEPQSGLDLRTVAAIERGGDNGPALAPNKLAASLLLTKVTGREMPPPGEKQLSVDEIARIESWVLAGAPADSRTSVPPPVSPVGAADRAFWSFRPLKRTPVPVPRDATRVRNPIDAFLLQKLEAKNLDFSRDADETTLVRRVYLDLIGLPPSPDEVDAFLNDDEPKAFERLVERLMSLPQFGERWGRHWLDVAGYVDTVGFDTDATNVILSEGKWRYRDYVIQAINDDKPYDQFLTEQLAGDELFDWRHAERYSREMRDALIATGYLRTARDLTHEDVGVIPQNFFGIMHDTLETVGTGLLGLTLNCVRCHSHKFDPIPQEDYYRLMATLTPAYNFEDWRPVMPFTKDIQDRSLPDVGRAEQAEIERHNAQVDSRISALKSELAKLNTPHEERLLDANLASLPDAIRADTKAALRASLEKRTEIEKYLAEKFASSVGVTPDQIAADLSADEKAAAAKLQEQIAAVERDRQSWGKIQALFDVGRPPTTRLLVRGNETSPGPEVQPGYLRVLCESEDGAVARPNPPYQGTSGRRLALARWLTARGSPAEALVSRVMVNRLWQQTFGRGIVTTPDNFGIQGEPPTHPELLEWLSNEFVASGWRIKPLLKMMVLSTAYRQSSCREPATAEAEAPNPDEIDPGNELLWRMRLRRLESEAVRDSILAVCGTLNLEAGGPPVPIKALPDGMVAVEKEKLSKPADYTRRSVYLVARRAYNLSLLSVFDQPVVATNCVERAKSAVPLQSLFMMNDEFLAEQAEHLAQRVEQGSPVSDTENIKRLFRLVLTRLPSDPEIDICQNLLRTHTEILRSIGPAAEHQALVQLCHTLLNTSEFLYVE